MAKLKTCKYCKGTHRLKSQFNKCRRRHEKSKMKPCKYCGVVHRKKSARLRCERRHKKESW